MVSSNPSPNTNPNQYEKLTFIFIISQQKKKIVKLTHEKTYAHLFSLEKTISPFS